MGSMVRSGDPNLTDVNGAAGAMDEDGDLDTADGGDTNEAPEGDDEEEEALAPAKKKAGAKKALADEDHSPLLHGLALKVDHPKGMDTAQTTIVATVHTGTGIHSKRMVLTGEVTVQRLAAILQGVADW